MPTLNLAVEDEADFSSVNLSEVSEGEGEGGDEDAEDAEDDDEDY